MKKEMLINVLEPEECRIAILENGVLEELYVERTSHESYVGNIYKGRIVNIEPSIQAAFVDFGVGRNGFLHVSDVEPTYYRHLEEGAPGQRGRRRDYDYDDDRQTGRNQRNGRKDRQRGRGRRGEEARGERQESRPAVADQEGIPPEPAEQVPTAEEHLSTEAMAEEMPRSDETLASPAEGEGGEESGGVFQHTLDSLWPETEVEPTDSESAPAVAQEQERVEEEQQGPEEVAQVPVAEALPEEAVTQASLDEGGAVAEAPLPGAEEHTEPETEAPLEEGSEAESATEEPTTEPAGSEAPSEESPAPKTRRRTRSGTGTRRKKTSRTSPPPAEQPPAPEQTEPPSPEGDEGTAEPPSDEDDSDPPRPQLMDSAERRTSESDSDPESAPELSPGPEEGGEFLSDEDLLFSRPGGEDDSEKENDRDEPEGFDPSGSSASTEVRVDEGEEGFSEEGEETLLPLGVDEEPPRRARPRGRQRSIEQDLEEDLRAASVEPFTAAEREEFIAEPLPEEEVEEPPPGFDIAHSPLLNETVGGPGRSRDRDRDRDRGSRRGGNEGGRGRRRREGGGGRPGSGRPKPLIQDIFKRGQEVIVQVIKEGIGTKGPTLSTYISIAGRYLVLMPGLGRVGVSRKIQDEEQRRTLREIFHELKPPHGLGFIIRTAGMDKTKKELQRDLAYLLRLWQVVVRRIRKTKAPAEIYQESDMITRTIRDTFTNDIDTIWVDERVAYEQAQEFFQVVMPRFANRLKLYEGKEPLFHRYGIEEEIARIHQRKVPLPQGGSIVIEQTEALVAIDVNSGNFRADNNAEETAFQMNLLAAKEIARQLRLRDLGGVIVNDFIDMRDEKHRRAVERALRDAVKRDRARTKILRISAFGIVEMTRQRIRPSLKRSVYQDCGHCHGAGVVKSVESMSIEVIRLLQLAAYRDHVFRIDIKVTLEVANLLLNKKRRDVARLEEGGDIQVTITGIPGAPPEMLEFVCYDGNGNEVKFMPLEVVNRARR